MASLRSLRTILGLALLCGIFSIDRQQASAQERSGDPLVDRSDNPTGRADFERERRADPRTQLIPAGIRRSELIFAATLPTVEDAVSDAKGDYRPAAAVINWVERGPGDQGGRTRALAIDLSDETVILAGGVSGGLWRSSDRGESWTRMTAIDEIHSVTTLAQDPRPGSRNVWYYGTGETRANSAGLPGDGIFRSDDGGLTWRRLAATMRNTPQSRDQIFDYVHRVVVDPSSLTDDVIYAACYGGIARSTDGGESWNEVLGGFSNGASYTDVAITSDGILYATLSSDGGRTEGIWRSTDGVDWTEITPAGFPQTWGRIVPAIAPSREDLVYFFARTPGTDKNGHSLWVYDHNGGNGAIWENRSYGLLYNTETYTNYCQTIAVAPYDEDVVFLGHIRMQRTTDGFRDSNNLRTQNAGGQHNDQHHIVFFPSRPTAMLAGHDGGISYCQDNTEELITWEFRNRGYATTQFYSIAIDHTTPGDSPIIGGTQDNGTWMLRDEGLSDGRKIFGADGGYAAIADGGVDFYTSYQNGQIFRSQYDSTGKRTAWARIDPEGGEDYLFIHPFTLDRADNRILYLPEGNRLWRNRDVTAIPLDNKAQKRTTNWELIDEVSLAGGEVISALASTVASPAHRLYFGTNRARLFRLDSAAGEEPTLTAIPIGEVESGYVNSFAVDPADGNRLLAAFSNYNVQSIFYSTDGGQEWEAVSGNLEEFPDGKGSGPSISWVAMLPVNGFTIYFAGTTTGLYSTLYLDGMNTVWRQEGSTSIGNVVIDMIAARDVDGFVAVGTHGRGVFSANVAQGLVEAHLLLSEGTVAFDTTGVGSTSLDTFEVRNREDSRREISGVVDLISGPFEIVQGGGEFTLAPGETLPVVVRFTPEIDGLIDGKVSVVHDATTPWGVQTVWLVGRGRGIGSVESRSAPLEGLRVYYRDGDGTGSIEMEIVRPGSYTVELVDASGRVTEVRNSVRREAGDWSLPFDAAALPSGSWFVRISSNGATVASAAFTIRR